MEVATPLEELIGRTFKKSMHGQTTYVILKEVRRRKVCLRQHDREDSFLMEINEFRKKFEPV